VRSPNPVLASIETNISRSDDAYGSGLNRTALTTVKIAVLAPMPSANVRMAAAATAGRLRISRSA